RTPARPLLAGRARRRRRHRAAGRPRRALPVPPSVQRRGALPAPVHLRARARAGRRGQDAVGHAAEVGERAPRAGRQGALAVRRQDPLLQPVHHPARPRHRAGLLAHAAAHARRALHPRGRARPRDARRPRRQRGRALHVGVRAGLLPGRAGRRAHQPHARHHAGHGHRDHRGGVRGGRHRRPRLLLGHLLRRAHLRPGAVVRHPVLPALLDLRGLRPHGGGADPPAVGPAGAPAQVKSMRAPWELALLAAALLVPAFGARFYTFLANDVLIWALFATSLNLLVGYTGLVSFGHAAYFGIGAYTTGLLMKKLSLPFLIAFPAAGVLAGGVALLFGFF